MHAVVCLNHGCDHADAILAILAPPPPPKHLQRDASDAPADFEEDSFNDPARFRLPANATPLRRKMAAFLQHRLKLPDVVLVVLFGVRPWAWVLFLAWLVAAPVAAAYKVAPLSRLPELAECTLLYKPSETFGISD